MQWRTRKLVIGGPDGDLVGRDYADWRFIKRHPDWKVAKVTGAIRRFFAALRTVRFSFRRPPDHWRNDPH